VFDGFNYHCIDGDNIVKLTPIKIIHHTHKMTKLLTKRLYYDSDEYLSSGNANIKLKRLDLKKS